MLSEATSALPSLLARRMNSVSGSIIRQMLEVTSHGDVISFAGGLPPVEALDIPGIGAAVSLAIEQRPMCLQYGLTNGVRTLREALCELMGGRGAGLEPDELIVTTGSQQAIALVGEAVLNPSDVIAMERPTYPAAIQMASLREAMIITAASDQDGIDVGELERRIVRDRPKLLYLVPTFGNPSGAVHSLECRMRILELAVRYNFLIFEDDPYSELYFDVPPPPPLIALAQDIPGARERCAYCSSLSKIVSPGLRLGWLIAPRPVLRAATIIKQGQDAHTSTLVQQAAVNYIKSGQLLCRLPHLRKLYRTRAALMTAALNEHIGDAIEYKAPLGGMFLWARLRDSADSGQLLEAGLRRGVAFVPGSSFMAESPDASTLRLSYAATDPAQIREGVARLAGALKGMRKC